MTRKVTELNEFKNKNDSQGAKIVIFYIFNTKRDIYKERNINKKNSWLIFIYPKLLHMKA